MKILFLACALYLVHCNDEENTKNFLQRFGYYNPNAFDGSSDIKNAISDYQKFYSLNVTGTLTDETKEEIAKPRCGVADKGAGGNAFHGAKWPWRMKSLTYSFQNTGRDLNSGTVKDTIRKAYGAWAQVAPLSFREVSSRGNMNIGFLSRSHGDGSSFDGRGRVLAHAFFPPNGRIHFDEDEQWSVNGARGVDLFEIATHEIGHALGLDHSNVRGTVMWPSYSGYRRGLRLHSDDVAGIQKLYGRRTGGGGTTTGGGGCRYTDQNKYCADWKRGGYCTNSKYPSVKTICKKSCYC